MMPTHAVSVEVSTLKWVGEPSSCFVSEVDLYYYWVGFSTAGEHDDWINEIHQSFARTPFPLWIAKAKKLTIYDWRVKSRSSELAGGTVIRPGKQRQRARVGLDVGVLSCA